MTSKVGFVMISYLANTFTNTCTGFVNVFVHRNFLTFTKVQTTIIVDSNSNCISKIYLPIKKTFFLNVFFSLNIYTYYYCYFKHQTFDK